MNAIEARGLGKRYGHAWALRDCTLTVPAGHLAALDGLAFVAQDAPVRTCPLRACCT